jgi:hypothetical protein
MRAHKRTALSVFEAMRAENLAGVVDKRISGKTLRKHTLADA